MVFTVSLGKTRESVETKKAGEALAGFHIASTMPSGQRSYSSKLIPEGPYNQRNQTKTKPPSKAIKRLTQLPWPLLKIC